MAYVLNGLGANNTAVVPASQPAPGWTGYLAQMPPWQLVGAGLLGGVLIAKMLERRQPMMPTRNPYAKPISKATRRAGERECIFGGPGTGEKCRFPVGTRYHERKALQYVQAGRCAADECGRVISYLSRHADDPDVRSRARRERSAILGKSKRARTKRKRTRARRR